MKPALYINKRNRYMKALIVKEDGLIYVNEVPEYPKSVMRGENSSKFTEYEAALASAKESAILVSDQEKARELICNALKSLRWKKPGIYPIPYLQWEVKAEPIDCPDGIDGCEVMHLRNVAILKESTPLHHAQQVIRDEKGTVIGFEPFNKESMPCTFSQCGCEHISHLSDCKKGTEQESQEELWKEIYIDFEDGEGWIAFAKRMNEHFTITRKP